MSQSSQLVASGAVVVPGPNYMLAVPEVQSAVIDLLSQTAPDELVRVNPRGQSYTVAYRPAPAANWETLAETSSLEDAVEKAAHVQGFSVERVQDGDTGLEELYLNPGGRGGFALSSRDHFPFHLSRSDPQSQPGTIPEFLIEAPNGQQRAVFDQPAYAVKTQSSSGSPWQTIRTVNELVTPASILPHAESLSGVTVWSAESSSLSLHEFVQQPPGRSQAPFEPR